MEEAKMQPARGFDKLLLEYEIKSHGLTVDGFCDAVGMARSTYQFWASGRNGDWTRTKIARAAEVLGLSDEQIIKIFFAQKVAQ